MFGLDSSFNFGLPFLLASQAQKHVTFNESIVSIDNLLMLAVKSRNLAAPPTTPTEGDRYIIPTSPNGEWVGKAGHVAANCPSSKEMGQVGFGNNGEIGLI